MFDLPHDPKTYTMPLGDHLEDLRRRLILSLVVPIPLALVLFMFSDGLVELLLEPLLVVQERGGYPQQVQVLSPPEFLLMKIKLSVIFAIVISVPWIIMQIWLFIAPGLYPSERRYIHILFPGSIILTFAGLTIMYFVMLPIMLHVLMSLTSGVGMTPELIPLMQADSAQTAAATIPVLDASPEAVQLGQAWIDPKTATLKMAVGTNVSDTLRILSVPLQGDAVVSQVFRLTSFINFVLLLLMGITIAFQMPLVILLLGWIGIVTPEWLSSKRKYALLLCAILAALTTPADIISMFLMLIPLYFLFELGILLLRLLPASRVGGTDLNMEDS
ncbi:MAG: twin-arginine translocase subunit TatC [Planctomycetota bacterium]|nr:twin-arginine translocase subunit TatC [Planctomycetota bacterium]